MQLIFGQQQQPLSFWDSLWPLVMQAMILFTRKMFRQPLWDVLVVWRRCFKALLQIVFTFILGVMGEWFSLQMVAIGYDSFRCSKLAQ